MFSIPQQSPPRNLSDRPACEDEPRPWLTCRLCGVSTPLVVSNTYHVGGHGDVELAECYGRACEAA